MLNNLILIVGYGRVGRAMYDMFSTHFKTMVYDPYIDYDAFPNINFVDSMNKYQFRLAIICIPTPMDINNYIRVNFESGYKFNIYACDTTLIEEALVNISCELILIKSTVPPGTCDKLQKIHVNKKLCFSPEYISEARYDNDYMFMKGHAQKCPMVVIGGEYSAVQKIFDLIQPIVGPQKHLYYAGNTKNAELIKYMENDYFGKKVVFSNEARQITEKSQGEWYVVYEGWKLDPRIDSMHTAAFEDSKGFGGKCLPKDLMARCYSVITMQNFLPYFTLSTLIQNTIYNNKDMCNDQIESFEQISKICDMELVKDGKVVKKINPVIR